MKKIFSAILILFATGFISSACGPSPEALSQAATQDAAGTSAAKTASAPTPTPMPTPSPTATATATLTPTPTNTATPTASPTITPSPTPRLLAVVLTLDDLPEGFRPFTEEELDDIQSHLPPDGIGFGFIEEDRLYMVLGQLIPYTDRASQTAFDKMMPGTIDSIAVASDATEDPESLPDVDDIGETRAGSTFVADTVGFPFRWDVVIFRRGEVGALLYLYYPDGEELSLSVSALARLVDERIMESMGFAR